MAKEIYIVIKTFGRGMAALGQGWDWSARAGQPARRGIGRHFARVGMRMRAATIRFAEEHPEIPCHA